MDYRTLNVATLPDSFPIPYLDSIIDDVAGHEMYLFLDNFSGYNQIWVAALDQPKTAFTTAWGVFRIAECSVYLSMWDDQKFWSLFDGFYAGFCG